MATPLWSTSGTVATATLPVWDVVRIGGQALPGIAKVTGNQQRKVDKHHAAGADGGSSTDLGYQPAEFSIALRMWTAAQLAAWDAMRPKLFPRPRRSAASVAATPEPAPQPTPAFDYETANFLAPDFRATTGKRLTIIALPTGANSVLAEAAFDASSTPRKVSEPVLQPLSIDHPALAQAGVRFVYVLEVDLLHEGSPRGVFETTLKVREFEKPTGVDVTSTATAAKMNLRQYVAPTFLPPSAGDSKP